jgi:ammonium transporter, Amt family
MYGSGQFSPELITLDLWYFLAAFIVLIAIAGLTLIDSGVVRRGNVLDNAVQKMAAIVAGGFGMMWIGYPIWYWQFNQAFGVDNSLGQAIADWWVGGGMLRMFSTDIDPAVLPEADVLQIFFDFFVTFGMLAGALLHGALVERVKIVPLVVGAFVVGAVVEPFLGYLLWGSMSPLTNNGFHDFAAVGPVYLGVGAFSLAFNLFIKPRLGRFEPHHSGAAPASHNPSISAVGVLLLMTAVPFILIGSGYFVPGTGFFGISFASSGIGVVGANLVVAYVGGGIVGVVIAYRRHELSWALFGPLAGYVITGTMLDITSPLVVFVVSLFGPPLMLAGYLILERLRIDDPKLAPLAILPGAAGIVITGFVGWGTPQGGYPGLEGEYAFQGAHVTPWMQLVGTLVALVGPFLLGLLVAFVLTRTTGLRISEQEEIEGQDRRWLGHAAPGIAPADEIAEPATSPNGAGDAATV